MVHSTSQRVPRLLTAALWIAVTPQLVLAQTAAVTPADASVSKASFDVISIKPSSPDGMKMMMGFRYTPDGTEGMNVTLAMLVRAAFGGFTKLPTDDSVTGLPDWGKTQTYDIQGKMSEVDAAAFKSLGKDDQDARRQQMLQSLLEERFHLKVHREQKQVPDYDLVVAKGGPRLKDGGVDPNGPKDRDGNPMRGSFMRMSGPGKVQAQNLGMEQLANYLSQPMAGVGRMVVDKTGLTGKYNFSLEFAPDFSMMKPPPGPMTAPPPPDLTGPSIYTALQEQLGLKLQPGTGTIDAVVVDHVERPSDN
jgi:uncharacterized protein (TIGR03435 family)